MLAEERRRLILVELDGTDGMRNEELSRSLDVSIETIRRDLQVLEEQGKLRRVHGGAIPTHISRHVEDPYIDRALAHSAQKVAIANAVVSLLPSQGTIFLDLGTTVAAVVNHIPQDFEATIITTSVYVATLLAHHENIDVLLSGGRMRRGDLSLSGGATLNFLSEIYPDAAVISTGAIDISTGVTDFQFEELQVKHLMLRQARNTLVVADSSKFGKTAPFRVCDVSTPTHLITDGGLNDSQREAFLGIGAPLLIA